ncbi:unnamed protein product [Adineta ricciae]|uniref:Fatty acyl-CoA reductase n=1 Tax=Adineta ricciae TaxID=249248 RepID=A0A813YMC5_ADIRI|nr:unnamed protein product [Adineta ricciae]CAF1439260.1 unnamed protein product [Adineta ricciae]
MAPNMSELVHKDSTSAIATFFSNKTIFVTGATGFVGKCLLEKLVRSCPDIDRIHVLIRGKHNVTPQERLTKLCSCPLFDTIRLINPNFASKFNAMEGDVTLPNFGLSKTDEALLIEKCHIVFHSAATIRFDEPLRNAMQINVGSVAKLIELCTKMASVQAVIHVSTAYANCNESHIEEAVYPTSIAPEQLLKACEWMDTSMLDLITPELIRHLPNTYTFTKGLAEAYLNTHAQHLPLAIFRPSIIGPTWQEPVPGFIDNYSGYTGIIVASVSGFMRVMNANPTIQPNCIPADVVINTMITLAWHTATQASRQPLRQKADMLPVIHCCAAGRRSNNKSVSSQQYIDIIAEQLDSHKIAFQRCLRWPELTLITNKYVYGIRHFFQEVIFAYLLDLIMIITKNKPIFVRLLNKMTKSLQVLDFFSNNNWTFASENSEKLFDIMSTNEIDRQLFNFDVQDLNWVEYIRNHVLGVKKYLLKDDMDRMTQCYERNLRLKLAQQLISAILLTFLSLAFIHTVKHIVV